MRPPWLHIVRLDLAVIGFLAVAAFVACLALALAGYRATVGVILILCAVEAYLYWMYRAQTKPSPNPERPHFVPFQEPTTVGHL